MSAAKQSKGAMSEELYQDTILESSRDTTHRGELASAPSVHHTLVRNPLCGDSVTLWLDSDGETIGAVRFSGSGCAISQAAAALMASAIETRPVAEAEQLVKDFRALISGLADEQARERLGPLVALEGVRKFPARARCASIAFEALAALIAARSKGE
jgi:nitrogen fixation NifU-like protein